MGRVVREGDAAWTEEDTLLALEWQDWSAALCVGCGHHLTDSTDERNVYKPVDQVCFACEAKDSRVHAISENKDASKAGRKVGVVFVERLPEND